MVLTDSMINPVYLSPRVIKEAKSAFYSNDLKKLFLPDFLLPGAYAKLFSSLRKARSVNISVPHMFSYGAVTTPQELIDFSKNQYFLTILSEITGRKIKINDIQCQLFSHRNFTLLHDEVARSSRTELFMTFCEKWDSSWGGNRIYTRGDGKQEPVIFSPQPNSLGLISIKRGWMSFTKYVNNFSNKKALFVVSGRLV